MAKRLLLADDSITIQKVVELVLAEEDFEIKSVSNGEDALKIVDTFKPDVVLADIEMPKVNGYQLCEKIKQNPSLSSVPVILLAGAFEPIDEDLARQVGADDSVIKPFESQELISKINAALTMVSAGEGGEVFAEAVEEPFDVGEEAVMGAEAEEVAEVAGDDEDLWAMEEVTAAAEELPAEEAVAEVELAEAEAEIEFPEAEVPETAPFFAPKPGIAPEPHVTAAAPARVEMPAVEMPSREELLGIFEKTINERVSAFLAALDIKEAILSALTPSLKDSIDKVLWEISPEIVEKMTREALKGSVSLLGKEVEKVIWDTVPDLAATMISKEIERIKSEF
ncbi:MAG: response regulator [Nitrospiraceae bacterium]|nr:response regulator [Nitrospiraceae bacterium]